ncbi:MULTISPECIES: tyrosinase family protein [unclassified Streptomyces]|uniref:tyrosinase MelC2 n=1 Tax=unclassified Streptomyces TaxID=2593676 RepID=UPI001BEACA0A|nr:MULTISPECIES: tyrosinase family protein [unclassified Streptomyces]MBT2408669.1 tyrosinase family protein [Streptomyces sp. ISL-21]MBT2608647.1 tyrosinase family protein [Streptomyces sp. ISL-87]
MTVRKNQAKLTPDEKRAFTNALLELKRTGVYDRFVTAHNTFLMTDSDFGDRVGHRSPSFLPWHRRFLLEFEAELQKVDAKVSLPYWDWTVDRTASSSLWAADFLGGTGRVRDGQVLDGPFAYAAGKWAISGGVDRRPYLRRALGTAVAELPTKAEVNAVLAMPVYDTAPWNSSSDGFRNHLEGWRGANIHNRVHVWVGGQMASAASPNDPVFWMHHAFIDMLWAEWQHRHPKSTYLPGAGTADVVDLKDTMRPWNNVTPADMLDHRKFYTFDTEAAPAGAGGTR